MMNKKFTPLLGDYPIQSSEEDLLDREKIAKHFVKIVLNLNSSRGVVTSVFGPWGSGKTSFINLVTEQLKQRQHDVLEFNPWMYSGAQQLIRNFFSDISAQMISDKKDNSLKRIGDLFRNYSAHLTLIPDIVSQTLLCFDSLEPHVSLARRIFSRFRKKSPKKNAGNLRKFREQIETTFRKRDRPIVIVIDDIDRLPTPEIQDVFQLVRLTASFPNLIYIVICDRAHVEKALGLQGISGRDYLEKIIQFPFDLPRISRTQVNKQTSIAIEQVLSISASPDLSSMPHWPDIYHEIVLPLIRNIRDVRRYAIAVQQTLINFDQEIDQVDILALEAIRLFLPDVFKLLPEAVDILTIPSTGQHNRRRIDSIVEEKVNEALGPQASPNGRVEQLINAGKPQEKGKIVRCLLRRLFPAAPVEYQQSGSSGQLQELEQLQNRRVAHENILRLYLEQTADPDLLAFDSARRALQIMKSKTTFENFWRKHDPRIWLDIILYLGRFEDKFLPEDVNSGVIVLFNLLPSMPTQPQHSYHDNRNAIIRVTLRLLRKLESADAIEASVQKILKEVSTLSSKMDLIKMVGPGNNIGHNLVSEVAVKKLAKTLCKQVQSASSDDMANERDPASLIRFAKFECGISDYSYMIENAPKLTYSLLRSSQNQASESFLNSRNVRFLEPTIDWDFLSKLYDGEAALIACIKKLVMEFGTLGPWFEDQNIPISEAQQTLRLAREYIQTQS